MNPLKLPKIVLAIVVTLLSFAEMSHAAAIGFTVDGEMLETKLGYTVGQPVSFTFVLRDYRPETLRVSPDPPSLSPTGAFQFGWYQDLRTQAHLWADIYGTGLTGDWNPTIDASHLTTSNLTLDLFPNQPPSNRLQFQSFNRDGSNANTGLFANGFQVTGFQVDNSYSGLDARTVYGDQLAREPVPDPTDLFSGLTGTYLRDPNPFPFARLDLLIPAGGGASINFRVHELTIAPVPVPATVWLFGFGLVVLGLYMLRSSKVKVIGVP